MSYFRDLHNQLRIPKWKVALLFAGVVFFNFLALLGIIWVIVWFLRFLGVLSPA